MVKKQVTASADTAKPTAEPKKGYGKIIKFYFLLILSVVVIWGIIFGGLASVTNPVLGMSLLMQSLALFIGFGTVMLMRDLIRHHQGKD